MAFFLGQQATNGLESAKNDGRVRGIWELMGQVLARPVLVMLAIAPELARRNIVNHALIGNPNLIPVLPIPQRQLGAGVGGQPVVGILHAFA